jgi:3',5'-nucleoside bisphosphate phosphatase
MIPPLIVRQALARGLNLIAVTDHNAAANCAAVMQPAQDTELAVLPGMEVQTVEEVHTVCLFDTIEQALTWQGIVFDHLPDQANVEELFGAQYVVDAEGGYIRTETRLLQTSTDLPLEEILRRVKTLGGLAIPAHVDRPSFSLLANLGMVPSGLDAPALELFRLTDPTAARTRWPDLAPYPLIRSGDAHRLSEITPALKLTLAAPTIAELTLALAGSTGRSFSL